TLGLVVNSLPGAAGATWTQSSAPSLRWNCIACSADGTRLVAGGIFSYVWTSTNSGVTWTGSYFLDNWSSVASSADGTRLLAPNSPAGLTSTASGVLGAETGGAEGLDWAAVSVVPSSADATQLAAAVAGGGIFTSPDAGSTWTQGNAPAAGWAAIASSADGS